MKIGTKLIVTYILIIVFTFGLLGILFYSFMERHLILQTQKSLIAEGRKIARVYGELKGDIKEKLPNQGRVVLSIASSFLEGQLAIFDGNRRLIYPTGSRDIVKERLALKVANELFNNTENRTVINTGNQKLVAVSVPFKSDNLRKGWVVLFTRLSGIKAIRNSLVAVLARALLITGTGAVIVGIVFSRTITKPIKELARKADHMARRDFKARIHIKTGDELEELVNSFNRMGVQLEDYYNSQKRFLQNVSHDFKTPLMSIQGYAEAVKEGVIQDEVEIQEALQVIVDECQRLKSMVDELIYLSKLETFKDIYRKGEERIFPIVEESVKKVKGLSDRKGIKLLVGGFDDTVVFIDREKFIKALVNILGNSIRYARTQVIIKGYREGNLYKITVEDDGPGLEKGKEKVIFERFYKGHKGDTGLGLAITKAIIEGHSGTIMAQNREEGGCRFIVRLPV